MLPKPLVIKTINPTAAGVLHNWNAFPSFQNVIKEIATPGVNPATDLNKVISAIPSPLARTKMFKYALLYNPQGVAEGIEIFYQQLRNEWKGLLSCIALDSAKIEINKIELKYAGNNNAGLNNLRRGQNIFEPTGGVGNMLFEDRDLWCVTDSWHNREQFPFIYTIKFISENPEGNFLIGGTSPESILFTSPSYQFHNEVAAYIDNNGKLTDPITNHLHHLDADETQILYVYVDHLKSKLDIYQNQFIPGDEEDPLVQINFIRQFLDTWLSEIQNYANQNAFNINLNAFPVNINIFQPPFDVLFNNDNRLFGFNGLIRTFRDNDSSINFDPAELLISHHKNTLVRFDDIEEPTQLPIFLLSANGQYFSLPLGAKGIVIFQDHLEDLLGLNPNPTIGSRLRANFNDERNSLTVTLSMDIDGNPVPIQRTYSGIKTVKSKNLIVWPNFISKLWKDYYLFSELPNNDENIIRAIPLKASKENFKVVGLEGNKIEQTAELIINNKFKNGYEYEIYKSELPYKGVQFEFRGEENDVLNGGVLLFKNLQRGDLRDFRQLHFDLTPVNVGFDFGSNNICISYKPKNDTDPALISFSNRKVFILGAETPDKNRPALPHEVLFFPSEPLPGNHVKSMIALHDELAIIEKDVGRKKEVSGGMPCFSYNLEVINNDKNTYIIKLGSLHTNSFPEINVMHSLKWADDNFLNQSKISLYALLKSLWLMIYAELLENDVFPEKLMWAYPSSMRPHLVGQYLNLWMETAAAVNPLDDPRYSNATAAQPGSSTNRALTEAEAVANFALSNQGGMNVTNNTMVMGFDVGGSTSDFFCIAQDKKNKRKLIRQTSIRRLAAGKLAEATSKSRDIQSLLASFCKQNKLSIFGIFKYLNEKTASYYFNAVVDRLSNMEGPVTLELFYTHLNQNACKEIFVINSYLTGLLFFHAGQNAARMVEEPEYMHINNFQLGFFGRGGRMVEWLPSINPQQANAYFNQCFKKGFNGAKEDVIEMSLFKPKPVNTKAEVSFGLSLFNLIQGVDGKQYDIVGEKGYSFNGNPVEELMDIQSFKEPLLAKIGAEFQIPETFERFSEFLSVFSLFIQKHIGFNSSIITKNEQAVKHSQIGFTNYVMALPEWQQATKNLDAGGSFDFHSSLLILEGMAFFENKLIPAIF